MVKVSNRDWRRIQKTVNRLEKSYEHFKMTLENQDRVEDTFSQLAALLNKYQVAETKPEEAAHADQ